MVANTSACVRTPSMDTTDATRGLLTTHIYVHEIMIYIYELLTIKVMKPFKLKYRGFLIKRDKLLYALISEKYISQILKFRLFSKRCELLSFLNFKDESLLIN